ncbi:MAG: hypothetical protein JWM82_321, partial [Myxococcales bacterium]|nr:hypothetical protein [Myxococcales bacterium]
GGAGGAGGVSFTPMTIRTLRASPPAGSPIIYLKGVVVVSRVALSTAGELWVQDPGGGLGSGILVYCDYAGTVSPCTTYDRTSWKQFRRGQLVDVIGVFHKHTPTGAPASALQLRIESPAITVAAGTMDPIATPVSAADIQMTQLASEMVKGTYVSVAGPVAVSGLMPAEFLTTCPGAATGSPADHVVGFEANVGPAVLAVGLNLYETVSYCVADTCAGTPCTNPISMQKTFSKVLGIVEPRVSSATMPPFLRLSPTVDADLVP